MIELYIEWDLSWDADKEQWALVIDLNTDDKKRAEELATMLTKKLAAEINE